MLGICHPKQVKLMHHPLSMVQFSIIESTGVTIVPQHPEAAGLIEKWNALLKTQLQHQLGVSSLEDWIGLSRRHYML